MSTPDIPAGTWTIDPDHSEVGFSVRHMVITNVKGSVESYSGTITIGEDPLDSSVAADLDLSSITTGDDGRDEYLRTADLFDVANHPTLTFRSKGVKAKGNRFVVLGELFIRGITRSVELDLKFNGITGRSSGGTRARFSAQTEINRKDFDIEFNIPIDAGGVLVGERIKVILEVEAVLQAD